VAAFSGF
jgi:hypothetical protein